MLDQIMISVFEAETLFVSPDGKKITNIQQGKYSYDVDVENAVKRNLIDVPYVDVMTTLASIDPSKIVKETQEIKKVSKVEKEVYE